MSPENDLHYDATTSQVYKIWIVNILLSICTLGLYRFWGKTRLRRYMTAGFMLDGDRFEYTGDGKELFWGFVKATSLLLIISLPFFWATMEVSKMSQELEQGIENEFKSNTDHKPLSTPSTIRAKKILSSFTTDTQSHPTTNKSKPSQSINNTPAQEEMNVLQITAILIYIIYIFFFITFLPFVAVFQAIKYRASRLRYRGIRGHLIGSSLKYGIIGCCHTLLVIATLGLWKPFADLRLHQYKTTHLYFGNQIATFKPHYFKLFFYYFAFYICFVVGILCFLIPEAVAYLSPDNVPSAIMIFPIIGFILLPIGFFGLFFGYRAARNRIKYNYLSFGDIGFDCSITGWRLFKLMLGNGVIILFTLGLGYPWAMQRRQRFLAKNIKIIGDLKNSSILQAQGEKDNSGEGLSSFFDIRISLL
ncbi:DUF898 domain-containing protein [Candidatus Berkiella cookevillensis]|uniref:DUF898 domain-containing protein n=1 Tax=Candidatus Berkiella cookevillensis TaxID=437022 RepID=A0A0Q9YB06_9GAMM|nr:DUF898 family protein [Candidatus Berkiella cookevillensis]MCS5709031.1 DUF898 domain-containing protein [Candidatus Berkiella cookevillensis]